MPVLDVICLANSYKRRGRCIAGIRTNERAWIRPHAHTDYGELYPEHYTLNDGSEPQILDVVRINFESAEPQPHQPENWRIANDDWRLISRPAPASLAGVLVSNLVEGPALFGDTDRRIHVRSFDANPARASLALIVPSQLQWSVERSLYNPKQPRACFRLGGASYNLPVTDPRYVRLLSQLDCGRHEVTACGLKQDQHVLLVISLGEVFPTEDGYCYKPHLSNFIFRHHDVVLG